MGRYIGIRKINETNEIVSYMFEERIVEKEYRHPGEYFPYKVDSRYAYGFCIINKKTGEYILDKEGTDPYYFAEDVFALSTVERILREIYRSGKPFPEKTCFAS